MMFGARPRTAGRLLNPSAFTVVARKPLWQTDGPVINLADQTVFGLEDRIAHCREIQASKVAWLQVTDFLA
jgi:hypothetical protein